ncbi:hypothetical protein QA641_39105 [Bradyrhizobium sp. CB1650]|uniref:hypothetical protein n=1 Tax=Bradyrhizobium sp. CB1650 TaxID=3039153 RepID=UPI0024353048|nr:hypothetical protein [Bradyrhizobium sp. CB1650]WGD51402.1 hypothetical protein QA641_39105 [Bradyrhizobium sp. CB1650]
MLLNSATTSPAIRLRSGPVSTKSRQSRDNACTRIPHKIYDAIGQHGVRAWQGSVFSIVVDHDERGRLRRIIFVDSALENCFAPRSSTRKPLVGAPRLS